jgi:hypothetical protein
MSGCRGLCLWCGRPFPARRGGSPQRFCATRCRTAFWSALRRWGERAVSAGALAIADIRNGIGNGDGTACTLLPGAISPSAIPAPQDAAPAASADSAEDVAELLDDFLVALLELPGDGWPDLVAALPDEIYDRIDRYLEDWLSEDGA